MTCTNCGAPIAPSDRFCQRCGAAISQLPPPEGTAALEPGREVGLTALAGQAESRGRRVAAFLIDIIPAIILSILNLMPLIGRLISSSLIALYWLLRDFNEASPGKMVLGSRVVSADGSPATVGQRIGRNVTLAVPGLIAAIPFGTFIAVPLSVLFFFTEVGMLLFTGRRLGDILAGTTVVRR